MGVFCAASASAVTRAKSLNYSSKLVLGEVIMVMSIGLASIVSETPPPGSLQNVM